MNWSGKRWFSVMSLLLLGHLLAVFALHSRSPMLARLEHILRPSPMGAEGQEMLSPSPELQDPMVFASAHPRGFSAGAWVKSPDTKYELAPSVQPPRFLGFGRDPSIFPAMEPIAPRIRLPFIAFTSRQEAPESLVTIQGSLADRRLLNPPAVPVQFANDVLSNTVVQVGIQLDGFPLSARVVSGSGSRKADLDALQLARSLRFAAKPLAAQGPEPAPVEWGQLVFQWFSTTTPATNTPPPQAPPTK